MLRRKKLAFRFRCNLQPVTTDQLDFFPVDDGFSFSCDNTVNFLVVLMRMNKRNTSTGRKIVDADLSTG